MRTPPPRRRIITTQNRRPWYDSPPSPILPTPPRSLPRSPPETRATFRIIGGGALWQAAAVRNPTSSPILPSSPRSLPTSPICCFSSESFPEPLSEPETTKDGRTTVLSTPPPPPSPLTPPWN